MPYRAMGARRCALSLTQALAAIDGSLLLVPDIAGDAAVFQRDVTTFDTSRGGQMLGAAEYDDASPHESTIASLMRKGRLR